MQGGLGNFEGNLWDTDSSEGSGLVQNRTNIGKRFEDSGMFSKREIDRSCLVSTRDYFIWQLIFITCSWDTLIGPSSLLKTMIFSTLKAVGIPWDTIIEQLIKVLGFRVSASFTLGYISLDLNIGPIQAATQFHVIDAWTSYHMLLGDIWLSNIKLSLICIPMP